MSDKTRQPFKADRTALALVQGAVGDGNVGVDAHFAQVGAVASAAIPTTVGATMTGVVVAFVPVTPKFSGNYFVEGAIITGANATGASGAGFQARLVGLSGTLPVVGTTLATGATFEPEAFQGVGNTITLALADRITGLTVGNPGYIALVAAQGVSGAYTLASGCGFIHAVEGT